jgi:hypothetical protein
MGVRSALIHVITHAQLRIIASPTPEGMGHPTAIGTTVLIHAVHAGGMLAETG